jgi:hypothetical protein
VTFELSTLLAAGTVRGEAAGTCTLLGPEGPDELFGASQPQDLFWRPPSGTRGRYRPYFENYTVDASIFESTSVDSYR